MSYNNRIAGIALTMGDAMEEGLGKRFKEEIMDHPSAGIRGAAFTRLNEMAEEETISCE